MLARKTLAIVCTLAMGLLALPVPAHAAERSLLVRLLSQAGLEGLLAAIDRSVAAGNGTETFRLCMHRTQREALEPLYGPLVRAESTPRDLQRMDAFLRTPLGRKFADNSMVRLRAALQPADAMLEAEQPYSEAEQRTLQRLNEDPGFGLLFNGAAINKPEHKQKVMKQVGMFVDQCKAEEAGSRQE